MHFSTPSTRIPPGKAPLSQRTVGILAGCAPPPGTWRPVHPRPAGRGRSCRRPTATRWGSRWPAAWRSTQLSPSQTADTSDGERGRHRGAGSESAVGQTFLRGRAALEEEIISLAGFGGRSQRNSFSEHKLANWQKREVAHYKLEKRNLGKSTGECGMASLNVKGQIGLLTSQAEGRFKWRLFTLNWQKKTSKTKQTNREYAHNLSANQRWWDPYRFSDQISCWCHSFCHFSVNGPHFYRTSAISHSAALNWFFSHW